MNESRKKKLIAVAALLVAIEMGSAISDLFVPELFDQTLKRLSHLDTMAFNKKFTELETPDFSPATGRALPHGKSFSDRDCLNIPHTFTHDDTGARTYSGYQAEKVDTLLIGDAYTYGSEISDDATIAARLHEKGGIMATNLANRFFDPVQAFLYAKDVRAHYPAAKTVVLGIMYANINRIVNRYSDAYTTAYGNAHSDVIGLKPYMLGGQLIPLDPAAFKAPYPYLTAAKKAAKEDYWARPRLSFPYSLALLRGLTSNAFIDTALMKSMRKNNREFEYQYKDKALGENLLALLTAYATWAEAEHLRPIVVFLPRNAHDTQSPEYWMAAYHDQWPRNLTVKNLDFTSIDAKKYTTRPNGDCSLSAYGATNVALQYTKILHEQPEAPPPAAAQ